VARPVMELKGFNRIHLKPSEQKEITFVITPEILTMLNDRMVRVIEPGLFKIMIGSSSKDIRQLIELNVKP
jgi:beta-glucosidase